MPSVRLRAGPTLDFARNLPDSGGSNHSTASSAHGGRCAAGHEPIPAFSPLRELLIHAWLRTTTLDLRDYIRDIPDFPKPGILFKDITPLLSNPAAFADVDRPASRPFRDQGNQRDRRRRSARLHLRRSAGARAAMPASCRFASRASSPTPRSLSEYQLEYGTDKLEVHSDALRAWPARALDRRRPGHRRHDACLPRPGQSTGATVVACAFLIELSFLGGARKLGPGEIFSLITY